MIPAIAENPSMNSQASAEIASGAETAAAGPGVTAKSDAPSATAATASRLAAPLNSTIGPAAYASAAPESRTGTTGWWAGRRPGAPGASGGLGRLGAPFYPAHSA